MERFWKMNQQADEMHRMWDEEDEEEELRMKGRNTSPRPGGTNNKHGRPDYWDSTWGRMLQDPNLQIVGSPLRKTFTRRFRMPYPVYKRIVHWAKGWHEKNACDCTGRPRAPTELKILGYLRMVGRASCLDDIEELSYVKEPTMHAFFHKFSEMGRSDLFPEHVQMPSTMEELMDVEASYASVGMPGGGGSMDVVHIALGCCPFGLSNLCTGKEGYPTLGFNVICDHRGRALALMPGAYGSVNDQTMVKYDDAVEKVRTDELFTEYTYEVRNEDGTRSMEKGIYIIVDGGYLKWEVLQCGLKSSSENNYNEWRKRLESVRKDIECYFGRLKQRFKVLKIPNNFRKKHQIDNMMFTLVAMQNMILDFDVGMEEYQSWAVQLKWQQANVSGTSEETLGEVLQSLEDAEEEDVNEETDERWCRPRVLKIKKKKKRKANECEEDEYHDAGKDFSMVGLRGVAPSAFGLNTWAAPSEKEIERFKRKQSVIVKHYAWYCTTDNFWLRS